MIEAHDHSEWEEERVWIDQAKNDILCFQPLYERYYAEIFRYIYRRVDDEALAADLCSQTFYKALKGIKGYEWRGKPFGAWLYTIAANEIRKQFRRKPLSFLIDEQQWRLIVDVKTERIDDDEVIRQVFQQMNEEEVRLVEMKYFEDKTFKEMAGLLSMSESAIKMKVYRLLERIKKSVRQ